MAVAVGAKAADQQLAVITNLDGKIQTNHMGINNVSANLG